MFSGRFQRKPANSVSEGEVLRFPCDINKAIPEAATFWKLQPEDDHGYKDVL